MANKTLRVALVGAGPIGAEIGRVILEKPSLDLVAVVDIDPAKLGMDFAEIAGVESSTGITVTSEIPRPVDVVCHSTTSRLESAVPQIIEILEGGIHVITTCEEMAFPLDTHFRAQLEETTRRCGVSVLGTGVNPGFVMDKLALTLSSVCQRIDSVSARRTVNASLRREPLQRKIGAGLSPSEFRQRASDGIIRHMGMRESLHLLAHGLGLEITDEDDELIEPVLADSETTTDFLTVEQGMVAGVHQTIGARTKEGPTLSLELFMYVGARNPSDRVEIRGVPDVVAEVEGGIHGDRATAATVVNAIPRIVKLPSRLLTMDDVPVSFR